MKTIQIKSVLAVLFTFIVISCDKNEIKDLTPQNTIDCAPVGLEDAHAKSADYQKILNNYVSKGFPGITAAIYTPEDGLWVGAAGLSDIDNKTAMNTCNVLFSGSVAKLYTVTAAMLLYDQGKLDLNAKISEHLPNHIVENLPNAKIATIRQLMNHSAGMPDHDDNEELDNYVESNNGNLPSAEEQLTYLFNTPANFEPGTSTKYSSAHTLTLSLIIDKIAGEHHSNIISREIIQKLGLTETYYKNEPDYPSPMNMIRGYVGESQKAEDLTLPAMNYCEGSQGDAGIIASANDYLLFIKALMEGEIVKPSTLELMKQDQATVFDQQGLGLSYGLGLIISKTDNIENRMGHSGLTLGGMSNVYYYPTKEAYVVTLTNTVLENNQNLIEAWYGNLIVGTGHESILDDFESLIFE